MSAKRSSIDIIHSIRDELESFQNIQSAHFKHRGPIPESKSVFDISVEIKPTKDQPFTRHIAFEFPKGMSGKVRLQGAGKLYDFESEQEDFYQALREYILELIGVQKNLNRLQK